MSDADQSLSAPPTNRYRCVVTYSINGDLRFISHHDTLRLFKRALARAALPVSFSQGFNPQPRMSLPLPRPVGVASDDECLVVEFDADVGADDVRQRLQNQMPAGIRLHEARLLEAKEKLQPEQVSYRLTLGEAAPPDLEAALDRIKQADALVIERIIGKNEATRSLDIKPYLATIGRVGDDVEFSLTVSDSGTARPGEVAGLLGQDPRTINHRIRRLAVRWRR